MAFAVVKSLKQTIVSLVNDESCHISENSFTQVLGLVYGEIDSLQEVLEKLNRSSSMSKSSSRSRSINRDRVNALDGQIREVLCELEDILDFHVLDQLHTQIPPGDDQVMHPLIFTLDFEQLTQQIDSFSQTVKNMKAEYIRELGEEEEDDDLEEEEEEEEDDDDLEEEEDDDLEEEEEEEEEDDDNDEESDDSDDTVGLSFMFTVLKYEITEDVKLSRSEWRVATITGMAGIGKTTLAKKIFRDPQIATLFRRRAFVTIGQNYRLEAVLLDILTKVNPDMELDVKQKSSAAFLKRMVYQSLKNRSCFIVLDDLWHKTIWNELKSTFPKNLNNHCQVLLTSRLTKVESLASPDCVYVMQLLNKKESWDLLRKKVFGDQEPSCPQLVNAGKKIAENCDGLPLTIVKVAHILSRADRTPEYWNEVAGQKQHSVFVNAYDQMFEVLYRSYDYLPQYLKPFFLYIGVFPQNYEIPSHKLDNLWCGEGFDGIGLSSVNAYLIKLYFKNLVMILGECFSNPIKKIGLHSVFWYMCNKEARKIKFFYCLNTCADTLAEDMNSQRRLCIQNNVLFGIKDVHNTISSISTVRSLLCTGTYHQYPVLLCLGFSLRLLKVLDALTIRLYEFPMEAVNRVNLRYIALTLDAKLPSSISKLWNLRYLIVHQHVRIVKSRESSSYLPMEIWNMKKLEHLQVMGSDLPNPCHDDHTLPNLFILLDVSAQSCRKDIFKRIPLLCKLGIQIELAPDDDEPLCFFDDISHLHELKVLKCITTTPKIMSGVVTPPAPMSIFSSSLSILTLSGMGYPWEEMSMISSLPNLIMLKLQFYAFRGPKWVVAEKGFPKLESLVIEDTDVVEWKSLQDNYIFENLNELIMKHCYNLQEIPTTLFGASLNRLDIVDCNPLAQSRAEQLTEHLNKQYPAKGGVVLCITSSWGD